MKDKDCIDLPNLPIDDVASKLQGAIPTNLSGIPPIQKEFDIKQAFDNTAGKIGDMVSNAVDNFKNIATGGLPELNLPTIDPSKIFDKIDAQLEASLGQFNSIKDSLASKRLNTEALLNKQIDCVTSDVLKSDEVATLNGNLLSGVSGDIKNISNNQLRDFNLPNSDLQQQLSSQIATANIDAQKIQALKGTTFTETANNQISSLKDVKVRLPSTLDAKAAAAKASDALAPAVENLSNQASSIESSLDGSTGGSGSSIGSSLDGSTGGSGY
jgi:hypothetical protein